MGTCETCKFANMSGIYGRIICAKNPPTSQRVPSDVFHSQFPTVYEIVTNWPIVEKDDYCYQWKPKTDEI